VARLNIEHDRRLLADETDAARRQTMLRQLAGEATKFAGRGSREAERKAQ
jgi:hypothetical protein